jgi:sugar phosphate isomerase/epimerase
MEARTMNKTIRLATLVSLLAAGAFSEDWKLGVQAYSFRNFTFCETLDQLSAMGVKYVEAYSKQEIGGGIDGKTEYTMDAAMRDLLKAKLKEAGIAMISYGVVGGKNEADWRQLFEFAKAMDIKMINSEPNPKDYDLLVKLTAEYGIPVGIHNHAKPDNRYWDPQTVLDAIQDRSGLYAAPDNGHWARSGIKTVDGYKLLEGRMKSVHLKDMAIFGDPKKKECVPFGTGVCELPAAIAELKRQHYAGPFIIEYESEPENPAPSIQKCVAWFNANAK